MKKIPVVAFAFLFSTVGVGQTVDIVNDCSGIELKSSSRFDEIVSAIVFTISWPENEKITWESIGPTIRVWPSGGEIVSKGRRYLAFSAIGLSHLSEFDQAISPTEKLCVLKYTGVDVRLEALGKAENTEYYVSLNGKAATGKVENVNCESTVDVMVFPNPTQTEINVSIIRGSFSEVALISPSGKIAYLASIQQSRFSIPAQRFSPGWYTIRLSGADQYSTKIIIKK